MTKELQSTGSLYKKLICYNCKVEHNIEEVNGFCKSCGGPLSAQYHLDKSISKDLIDNGRYDMWRYEKFLPIFERENIVSLGEGFTKILPLSRLESNYNLKKLSMKEEASNPTGSFKARGMSAAVSKAKELGVAKFCTPTAGNAGSALAAYAAKAGLEAKIYIPKASPKTFIYDATIAGAEVHIVDGTIRDAGLQMTKENDGTYFDVSTMKEPFRLEGKKTLGYEIAEQSNWLLPDVIIYPTGGGTGLVGIWKAFNEMLSMGWIESIPTKMIAVQMEGCNPIMHSFKEGKRTIDLYEQPTELIANGLRVPKPFADTMVMDAIYQSNGCAVTVSEPDMLEAMKEVASKEGLFLSPEGGAVFAAMKQLVFTGFISPSDHVLFINTGSPYKYMENLY
jgi:threonine synthase